MSSFTDFESLLQPGSAHHASGNRRRPVMNTTKLVLLVLAIAIALYILFPNLSWVEDAAALSGVRSAAHCPSPDGRRRQAQTLPSKVRTNSDEPQKNP